MFLFSSHLVILISNWKLLMVDNADERVLRNLQHWLGSITADGARWPLFTGEQRAWIQTPVHSRRLKHFKFYFISICNETKSNYTTKWEERLFVFSAFKRACSFSSVWIRTCFVDGAASSSCGFMAFRSSVMDFCFGEPWKSRFHQPTTNPSSYIWCIYNRKPRNKEQSKRVVGCHYQPASSAMKDGWVVMWPCFTLTQIHIGLCVQQNVWLLIELISLQIWISDSVSDASGLNRR